MSYTYYIGSFFFSFWSIDFIIFHPNSNVGEALVGKGLATVIRYRQDDDQRSSKYDDLLAAEARASKNSKGLHSKKEVPLHRVADLSGVSTKAVTKHITKNKSPPKDFIITS